MQLPRVKVYGERNTGTNWLVRLIEANFEVDMLTGTVPPRIKQLVRGSEFGRDLYFKFTYAQNLGWKHSFAPSDQALRRAGSAQPLFITLTKNPYSWLLSLWKRPYHAETKIARFTDFIAAPMRAVGRENHDRDVFDNPVALWCQKNRSYLDLQSRATSCINLRYEDLVDDPVRFLARLRDEFGFHPRRAAFDTISESTKGDKSDLAAYRRYYLEEHWRSKLDRESIALINARLDATTVERYGYRLLADNDVPAAPVA